MVFGEVRTLASLPSPIASDSEPLGGWVGEGFGARSPFICLLGRLLAKDSTLESVSNLKIKKINC